ncbi:amidohydrolase family protein [Nocardioides fonticola]|uniref:Amidohydrolase family protein n=1 Tax=Nocardioides fonticola TaxID=450363 RepID=A0ABP7XHE9_9ACTN
MIIDAHQHVWDLERADYPWLGPDDPEWNRTFTQAEIEPVLDRLGVTGTVLVEAADNDEDTELMLDEAARHDRVVGIVAYVPLEDAARVAVRLADLRDRDRRVVGVRTLIHQQADPDWILRPEVAEGLRVVEDAGLTLDLVAVLPRHLDHVTTLAERHPRLRVVVDHLGKPPIGAHAGAWPDHAAWARALHRAAEAPLAHAKVSGLYPGVAPAEWSIDAVRRVVDEAVEAFGPARLMYGGDWPISVTAGGYERVFAGLREIVGGYGAAAEAAILADTARSFYRLP